MYLLWFKRSKTRRRSKVFDFIIIQTAIMKKSHCLFVVLFLLIGSVTFAQKRTITGKVTNQATGEALPGVNILANKQKNGTATKDDGTYSISVEKSSTVL